MSELERYFDSAATTPVDPRVVAEMLPFFTEDWGNANSIHSLGRRAMAAIDLARERLAELLGADGPEEIVFTSGATESNNWALRGARSLIVSPFEHSAVRQPALAAGASLFRNEGFTLLPDEGEYDLASVMLINNETGAILNPETGRRCAKRLHSDVTQAVGKIPFEVSRFDMASLSSHKFYGPKGVGALYSRGADFPEPWILGGEQEHGLRGGTLNVPAIVGLGAAAALAVEEMDRNVEHVRDVREALVEVLESCPNTRLNDHAENSPYIVSVSFLGVEGETIVIEADAKGFAISSGAACSSGSNEPSHVLQALNLADEWARGTVRVSLSRFNTRKTAQELGDTL